jgi:16S rRNA A1518/A1519 N6-dimethyltransferase RsmA/KsgA/DIM1 with predicted DNA glycosylase/AP lyase activity
MTGQVIENKNLITSIKGVYQSYGESQKKRGRKKKEMGRVKNRIAFYSQFIKKGDLCFDIGANVGNRTDTFLKLGAKVVAVEPQPDCLAVLNSQFAEVENVTIIPCAVDASVGQSYINVGSSSTLSTMSDEWIDSMKKSGRFEGHD